MGVKINKIDIFIKKLPRRIHEIKNHSIWIIILKEILE